MVNINGGNILLDVDYILKKAGVGPNKVVADLGCGTSGHFVFPFVKTLKLFPDCSDIFPEGSPLSLPRRTKDVLHQVPNTKHGGFVCVSITTFPQ